jgi:hypothetical protein
MTEEKTALWFMCRQGDCDGIIAIPRATLEAGAAKVSLPCPKCGRVSELPVEDAVRKRKSQKAE